MMATGCARLPIAPSPEDRARIERVAVVPVRFAPHSNYEAFARGMGEEMARGAAQGALYFSLEWLKWAKDPVSLFLLAPFVTAVGAVVGAAGGPSNAVPAETLKSIEATQEGALKTLRIQETFADKVISTPARLADYKLAPAIREVGPSFSGDRLTYAALRRSTDAVLEVAVTEIGFARSGGGRNPRVSLLLKASGRMVRIADGTELVATEFQHGSVPRPFSEWAADDSALLREALDIGLASLAENVVDQYLRAFPLRTRTGGWDVLGGPAVIAPRPGTFFGTTAASTHPTMRWEALSGTGSWARTDPSGALARAGDIRYQLRVWKVEGELATEIAYEQNDLRTDRHRLEQPLQPRSRYLWSVRGVFRTDGREYPTGWASCQDLPQSSSNARVPGCVFATP